MQYRKLSTLMSVAWLLAGVTSQGNAEDVGLPPFKGPSLVCLVHSNKIYPCISLTPPAYHPRLNAPFQTQPALLPIDDSQTFGWLARIKMEEDRHTILDDLTVALRQPDPAMKMSVVGPLKFKVYTEDGSLSESRFFLGIDRTW